MVIDIVTNPSIAVWNWLPYHPFFCPFASQRPVHEFTFERIDKSSKGVSLLIDNKIKCYENGLSNLLQSLLFQVNRFVIFYCLVVVVLISSSKAGIGFFQDCGVSP